MQEQNTPRLETERLILRRFEARDIEAILAIYGDREANRFLPWFPIETLSAARAIFEEKYAAAYREPRGYRYAICLKADDVPIGYVHVGMDESHDFGYGLRSAFWRLGIASEACAAVAEQLRRDGLPFITATHDEQNPRSGAVMRKIGMQYRYSYKEQWQPKNIPVVFCMYQLNFDGSDRVYNAYRERD